VTSGSEHGAIAVEGRGKTLAEAIEAAWEKARKHEGEETTLEVLRITVHGHNPISGYGVVLAPGGH